MKPVPARFARLLVVSLVLACLGACHFHGGHCHGFGHRSWCHTPVRHCR